MTLPSSTHTLTREEINKSYLEEKRPSSSLNSSNHFLWKILLFPFPSAHHTRLSLSHLLSFYSSIISTGKPFFTMSTTKYEKIPLSNAFLGPHSFPHNTHTSLISCTHCVIIWSLSLLLSTRLCCLLSLIRFHTI